MTTGRGIAVCSERSSQAACSSTSAFALSSRTAARRTEQTLIGSKVALRTSTRPASRPRGRCSMTGANDAGPGGVWLPIAASLRRKCNGPPRGLGPPGAGRSGGGIAAQEAHLLAVAPERHDRVGDGCVGRAALHVDVEEVVPEPRTAGPRLD